MSEVNKDALPAGAPVFPLERFAEEYRRSREQSGAGIAAAEATILETERRRIVEDVRSMLTRPGKNPEGRQQRLELLNRAVLGYPAERKQLMNLVQDFLLKRRYDPEAASYPPYESLQEAVFAEVAGMNVLELIMKDRGDLEEIQVVGTSIFEIRNGEIRLSRYRFRSAEEVGRIQQNLVLYNRDTLNKRKRWAEVMLHDGSRVTMTGFGFTWEPTLTIRFYRMKHFDLQTLLLPEFGTLDESMLHLLRALIRARFNLVIIGATNTGKTNLMKALISEMPDEERLVTIEGRRELMLKRDFPGKNVIEYEVNEEDAAHNAAQAFKLALRQSPKRICHAEIRDGDANMYVRACTRGHEGSMTTVHVNVLEDAPAGIADMCRMDGNPQAPEPLIRRICHYVTQFGIEMATIGSRRKIVRIGEFVCGAGEVAVRDLVRYDFDSETWRIHQPMSGIAADKVRRLAPQEYPLLRAKRWIGE